MKDNSGWHKFIANCAKMKTSDELQHFFELTLTGSEREKIGSRYLILTELLAANKTQRAIAADIGVSLFNVTRGANQLKQMPESVTKLITKADDE